MNNHEQLIEAIHATGYYACVVDHFIDHPSLNDLTPDLIGETMREELSLHYKLAQSSDINWYAIGENVISDLKEYHEYNNK